MAAAARARCGSGDWRIVHPPDWPADEQQVAGATCCRQTAAPRRASRPIPASRAGLKIVAGGNVIDGTLDGLLAERADFEARLLRRLEAAR